MNRTIRTAAGIFAAVLMLAGCMPGKTATVIANPDFIPAENVKLDFAQLQNDAFEGMASIEDGEPFIFITDVDISGNNDTHELDIRAAAYEDAGSYECDSFASALLVQLNDAAVMQDPNLEPSTKTSFGTLYDSYGFTFTIYNEADGSQMSSFRVPAGEEIPLDPDYEKYVEEWLHDYDVLMENAVYDVNGHMILDE